MVDDKEKWVVPRLLTSQEAAGVVFEKLTRDPEVYNGISKAILHDVKRTTKIYWYTREDPVQFARFILAYGGGAVLPMSLWLKEDNIASIESMDFGLGYHFGIKLIPGDDAGEIPEVAFLRRLGELVNAILPPVDTDPQE